VFLERKYRSNTMRRFSRPPGQFSVFIFQFSVFNFLTCALFLSATPAHACNIPVFRYALEHWPADPYEIVVFHRGPLSPADQAAVALMEKDAAGTLLSANGTLHMVDLAKQPEPPMRELFQAQVAPELPWLVVRYPAAANLGADAWSGRLSADAVHALVDSPVRQEIARRLLAGASVLWVLLESGDRAKDAAADRLLRAELRDMEETLKLPEPDVDDQPARGERPPLRLRFAVVRVSRQDPAEKVLVRMLLSTEPDLAERAEPMVFPVFGRGRVLYALVGAGINATNLRKTGAFLTGACSCEVKRENPGTDLLLTADWGILGEADPEPKPSGRPTVGETVPIPGTPAVAAVPPSEADQPTDAVSPSRWTRNLLVGAVALAVLLVLVTGTLALRSRKPTVPPPA
jgi:hypothetical protein